MSAPPWQSTESAAPVVGAVDVYIRTENQIVESVFLCKVQLERLKSLIDGINAWGVQVDGNTYAGPGTVAGQFVIDTDGAYFELIVSTEAS